jgi:hypothetical protein
MQRISPIATGSDDTGQWSGPGASRWVGVDLTRRALLYPVIPMRMVHCSVVSTDIVEERQLFGGPDGLWNNGVGRLGVYDLTGNY